MQTIRLCHAAQVPLDLRISDAGQGTRTHHLITDGAEAARARFERLGKELLAPSVPTRTAALLGLKKDDLATEAETPLARSR